MNDLDKRHKISNSDAMPAAYERIWELEQITPLIDTQEALEQLEATNNLSTLILQKHLPENLDSPANFDKEKN